MCPRHIAAHPDKGVEIHVDHSELDQSVKEAEQSGVTVTKETAVEKGTVNSTTEAEDKRVEIQMDYQQQIQKLKAAKQEMDQYHANQKDYEAAKKKYDQELIRYNEELEQYNAKMTAYRKAMEELEQKKNEDGYLSQPASQMLTFQSEPNAVLQIPNGDKQYSKEEWQAFFNERISDHLGTNPAYGANDFSYINGVVNTSETRMVLHQGRSLKVQYTGLEHSYFQGKKISRVEYTYTLKDTGLSGVTDLPVLIERDPTVTIWYLSFYGETDISMTAKFYDEQGKEIDLTGALLSFSSLNRGTGTSANPKVTGKPMIEKVRSFNGQYIPISGSSIAVQPDGGAYAGSDNESKAQGSRFETREWDDVDNEGGKPTWYGAIVGKASGTEVNLHIGATGRGVVWFALNSNIRALDVSVKPVSPTPPTEPEQPKKPDVKAAYHYDLLYARANVEKTVSDQDHTDIHDKAVQTGSVVKFSLHTSNLPAGHEKMESLVFKDRLPEGYELHLEETRQENEDYEVTYDEGSRQLTFTATADLLAQFNHDLSREVTVPVPVITGTVTKEGTTYTNDFDLTIKINILSSQSRSECIHRANRKKKCSGEAKRPILMAGQ